MLVQENRVPRLIPLARYARKLLLLEIETFCNIFMLPIAASNSSLHEIFFHVLVNPSAQIDEVDAVDVGQSEQLMTLFRIVRN